MATRTGPPIAPVLHRSLLTSLLLITGVMVVLRSGDSGASGTSGNQMLGYAFSALSFVLVAVALLYLKPRVPARRERQPVEEYWSSVTGTILPMWFVMEAASVIAVVGYFLTGLTVTAVAIAVSIGLFIWYGPKAFVQA
jgi:small-conductance mechanosensitive channel